MGEHIYKQVPWYVPILTALIVLSLLFGFGLTEQSSMIEAEVEKTKSQRATLVRVVTQQIENKLGQTKISAIRLARQLSHAFSLSPKGGHKEFDGTVEVLADGSIRSEKVHYNPSKDAGIFIPKEMSLTLKDKSMLIQSKSVIENIAINENKTPFVDAWYMPPSGGIVILWPQQSPFIYEAKADFSYQSTDWLQNASPELNPNKTAFWTNLLFDPVPKVWMLSAVSPVYTNNEWQGAVGHDIPLDNLLSEIKLLDKQQKSDFILFNKKGVILASDIYSERLKSDGKPVLLTDLLDGNWRYIFDKALDEKVVSRQQNNYSFDNKFYTVSYIKEQDWFLATSISLKPIYKLVNKSFSHLSNIAVASIVLELIILSSLLAWGHKKNSSYLQELQSINKVLNAEKNRYESLVGNISSMVYRCKDDQSWTMEYINGACEFITGYSAQDLINNEKVEFGSIIFDDDKRLVRDEVNRAVAHNLEYEVIFRITHKDGSIKWLLERGKMNESNHPGTKILEGVITDITALKETEFKLQDLNTNLDNKVKQRTDELANSLEQLKFAQNELIEEKKASALSKLVVGMAHELNTPLGNLQMLQSVAQEEITSLSNRLEQKKLTQNQLVRFIGDFTTNCESLGKNIKRIIDLSIQFKEVSASDNKGDEARFNLSSLVADCINCHKKELIKNQISTSIFQENITLQSYKNLLTIIIDQLVLNSIQHAFGDIKNREIKLEAKIINDVHLLITYSDNGSGIEKNLQNDLFEPFVTSERKSGSLGLGLNIVQNLVIHALGGTIKHIPGDKKTCFEIYLPEVVVNG